MNLIWLSEISSTAWKEHMASRWSVKPGLLFPAHCSSHGWQVELTLQSLVYKAVSGMALLPQGPLLCIPQIPTSFPSTQLLTIKSGVCIAGRQLVPLEFKVRYIPKWKILRHDGKAAVTSHALKHLGDRGPWSTKHQHFSHGAVPLWAQ